MTIPNDPYAAAGWWYERFARQEGTAEDRQRFEEWCAQEPAHALAYGNLETARHVFRSIPANDPRMVTLRQRALAARPALFRRQGFQIAATVLLAVVCGVSGWRLKPAEPPSVAQPVSPRDSFVFNEDTLARAIADFNEHSPVKLVLMDPRLGRLRISGVFLMGANEDFIQVLTDRYPIEIAARDPARLILAPRELQSSEL